MDKILYFVLDNNELYLDQIFVDFNGLPIYFSCCANGQYYLALCSNVENYDYIVVRTSATEIWKMLVGKISMHDTIASKYKHWVVASKDDGTEDVQEVNASFLDQSILPQKDAKYIVATQEVKEYLTRIEKACFLDAAYKAIKLDANEVQLNSDSIDFWRFAAAVESYFQCLQTSSASIWTSTKTVDLGYSPVEKRSASKWGAIVSGTEVNNSFIINVSTDKCVA